ncbi:hypothetical protein BDZ91DRAFT_663960 [Kalaharituber pfeilii]|nr:hypothetical protein BDZ91DRAFT_663960 [Kalaharituber pfeilii]
MARAFYIVMGGFEITCKQWGKEETLSLTPCGAILLAKHGLLPYITLKEIEDKSKADLLTKVLVCLQGGWMIIQAIARRITGLPVTLLEIMAVVHLVATIITYLVWMKKPQDVHLPTQLKDPHQFLSILLRTKLAVRTNTCPYNINDGKFRPHILRYAAGRFSTDFYQGPEARWLFGSEAQFKYLNLEITLPTINGLGILIYAAGYLAAWNDHFPTVIEKLFWRVSALYICTHQFLLWALFMIRDYLLSKYPGSQLVLRCHMVLKIMLFYLFVFCRAFLIVESFASIRSLPRGSYLTIEWVELVPHL